MENNYYWNHEHELRPYTGCQQANPGSLPPVNASREAPPEAPPGFWPAMGDEGWILIEDHRNEKGYVGKTPVEVKDFGPYPDGWSLEPPPPTAEELKEAAINACLAKLDELDRKSTRSMRAIETIRRYLEMTQGPAKADAQNELDVELDFLTDLDAEAGKKRNELAELRG